MIIGILIGLLVGIVAASIKWHIDVHHLVDDIEASWKKVCEDEHQKNLDFIDKIQKARIEEMNNYHSRLADKQEMIDSLKFQLSVMQLGDDEDLFTDF